MTFALTVQQEAQVLVVHASGPATMGELCGLFDFTATAAGKLGYTRALLDLQAVEIDFTFTQHLELGTHAASALSALQRVASVVAPKFRVGTSEKAAQKMGLRFRTFTVLTEARAWLEGAP